MYACPHCNKPGISVLRRAFLDPAIPAECVECGGKVGVPVGKSIVALSPFVTAIAVASSAHSFTVWLSALVLGTAVMFALSFLYVPLVAKRAALRETVLANPAIERTSSSGLRPLPAAAHVKR